LHGRGSVSIIIPALNEEHGIRNTINALPIDQIKTKGYDVEIIVVDGDSVDNTRAVASALGTRVILEKRKGYGRAYKTGFSCARGNIIVTLDADGTYPCDIIPDLITQLERNRLDFITVNRISKLEKDSMSRIHRFGNLVLSTCLSMLYLIKVTDSQSGMWVIKKDLINGIRLLSDDMALSEEIKIIAFSFFNSVEVEGRYSKRVGEPKLATFGHGWKNFCFLWKYRRMTKSALMQPSLSISVKR
jgi:glycosyltransferase involved in cell wall biosynthesis